MFAVRRHRERAEPEPEPEEPLASPVRASILRNPAAVIGPPRGPLIGAHDGQMRPAGLGALVSAKPAGLGVMDAVSRRIDLRDWPHFRRVRD